MTREFRIFLVVLVAVAVVAASVFVGAKVFGDDKCDPDDYGGGALGRTACYRLEDE